MSYLRDVNRYKTLHRYDNKKAQLYEFLRKEIQKGRQVYVVYPLIEGNEKLDYKTGGRLWMTFQGGFSPEILRMYGTWPYESGG